MKIDPESFNLLEMMEWTFALCAGRQEQERDEATSDPEVLPSAETMTTMAPPPDSFADGDSHWAVELTEQ